MILWNYRLINRETKHCCFPSEIKKCPVKCLLAVACNNRAFSYSRKRLRNLKYLMSFCGATKVNELFLTDIDKFYYDEIALLWLDRRAPDEA
jgi:hypothetical protein